MIAAIQGAAGSFSDRAARQALGTDVELLPCATVDAAIAAVLAGRAHRGVVAVENTLVGPLTAHLDRIRAAPVREVCETLVEVRLCLIGPPGARVAAVRRVAAHPVALAQCRRFFVAHPALVAVPCEDGAGALGALLRGHLAADAVIAPREAASHHGGVVLAEGLEDAAPNITRFVVIAARDAAGRRPRR